MSSKSLLSSFVLPATFSLAPALCQTYTISTAAGTSFNGSVPGTSANLAVTYGVASDQVGNVFFTNENAVLRLDSKSGIVTVYAGNGTPGYSGDNGPATSAQLNSPRSIMLDAAGGLYIVDTGNACIRKVSNGAIATVAGNGTAGFSGDGGPATAAQLNNPEFIAVDTTGNLYISDNGNNRIRKVSGGAITTIVGSALQVFNGANSPPLNALLFPQGIAVDSAGVLYIADSLNGRIWQVSNGIVTTFAGGGDSSTAGADGPATGVQLINPAGLAFDSAGALYIAERAPSRVRKVANGAIATVPGNGTNSYNGDNMRAVDAELRFPQGIALDAAGNLYIADSGNARIRKVSGGVIATIAGSGTNGPRGDNGPATNAFLSDPLGIAVDSAGSLYITDANDFRIRQVVAGAIATVAGDGIWGFSGDGGPASSAQLEEPVAVAVDSAGNLYIADYAQRIRQVSGGAIATVAGDGAYGSGGDGGPATSAQLFGPTGVAADANGNLYIADVVNNRIRKVSNGAITTVAGNGTQGFSGDGGPATSAQLDLPSAVAVDPAGNLYISDWGNNRIREVSNGVITTVAGSGTKGFGGDNGPATSTRINGAEGIAVDSAGNLYIADTGNNRVRKVSNGVIATIAGIGTPGLSGDGGPAASAQLNAPWGIAVDAAGEVYVSEQLNNRVRLLTPSALLGAAPSVSAGGVVNAASNAAGPLAPGSIATVYGSFLLAAASFPAGASTQTSLTGLSLQFGTATLAPLLFANATQVNFQVPWELAAQPQASLTAIWNGRQGASQTVGIAAFSPGIFTTDGVQGAVLNSSYALVDSSHPATAGSSVVQIYCTGLGAVTNQPPTGSPALGSPYSTTTTAPTVTIGGAQATVSFSGLAPGLVGGYQINAMVPAGSSKGAAVPVVVAIGGATSNTVTIAVQ